MNGRIEPTKANLIRLRREAAFAQEGLAILDRKREILLRELSLLAQECDQQRTKLRETIGRLSGETAKILASLGPRAAAYETIPIQGSMVIRRGEKRVMGVRLPVLSIERIALPNHPLAPQLDEIAGELERVMPELLSYVTTVCSMRRLAAETAKTQKREKAIEEIHLPGYRREISKIGSALDENEREELVRCKSLKRRLSADTRS